MGDIFSDISANSLEMTLLGCPGQARQPSPLLRYRRHVVMASIPS